MDQNREPRPLRKSARVVFHSTCQANSARFLLELEAPNQETMAA